MPPKRIRSSAEATTASSSAGSALLTEKLVSEWQCIANSKSRSIDLLVALSEGKFTTSDEHHSGCYWLFLATHIMNRIISALENTKTQASRKSSALPQQMALLLADLTHSVVSTLLVDRSKFEKTMASKRSILGRTMVTVTMASVVALQNLVQAQTKSSKSLWQCLTALEMALSQAPIKLTPTLDSWHSVMIALTESKSSNVLTFTEYENVEKGLKIDANEKACLTALQALTTTVSTPAKRRRLKKSDKAGTSVVTIAKAFEPILTNAVTMDGRISMRRWTAMTFVWLLQGHHRGLEIIHKIMLDEDHWSRVLDCPAASKEPSTVASISPPKKQPKTKSGKGAKQDTEAASLVAVPGRVALCTFVARIMDSFVDSSVNCSTRAPSGCLDTYFNSIIGGGNKKKSNLTKHDVRDLTIVTIYQLIQLHALCLGDNCPPEKSGMLILNDDTHGPSSCVPGIGVKPVGVARFYPYVHKSVDGLCRTIGSSIPNQHGANASKSTRKLLMLASCYVFASFDKNVMDAKLCNFAVGQLNNCLNNLLKEENNNAGDEDSIIQNFQGLKSLSPPVLPISSTKRNKKGQDDMCTYGGILATTKDTDSTIVEALFLPLFFRAIQQGVESFSPSNLISMLLDVLESCYETVGNGTISTPTVKSKIGTQRKKKRQKNDVVSTVGQRKGYRRLNAIRAGLASDVCNVLCIQESTHRPKLSAYLRQAFSTEQICRVIGLNSILDCIMTQSANEKSKSDSSSNAASSFFTPSSEFNLYERTLWSSHTNLCVSLGRGDVTFHGKIHTTNTKPILGDSVTRLNIFKEISLSCNHSKSNSWPLHLPASHHAFLVANFTSEPIVSGQHEPEDFVVNSLINSIAEALSDPSSITYTKRFEASSPKDEEKMTDEKTPLSFRDGRLLLVALSRLPYDYQTKHLTKLASVIVSAFTTYHTDQSLQVLVTQNAEIARFLARVLTIYVALLNLVTSPTLVDIIFKQVGTCQFSLPQLYSVSALLDGSTGKEGNWYTRDSCFMGLFDDWESPAAPSVEDLNSKKLPQLIISRTNEVIESALTLGIFCAGKDFGQLLFASWNAAGRRGSWDPKGLGPTPINSFNQSKPLAGVLLELREDLCSVLFQVCNAQLPFPKSLLGQKLKKTSMAMPLPLKDILDTMITKAESILSTILEKAAGREGLYDSIDLAVLECLPIYIAFIMSMHTKSSDTTFSRGHAKRKGKSRKRRRLPTTGTGYDIELLASIMSDEDSVGSGDDYEYQDATGENRIDALARLHDACNIFGAAPIHPDWLDKSCSFRDTITSEIGKTNAARALECLKKIGLLSSKEDENASKSFMRGLTKDSCSDCISEAAATICGFSLDTANTLLNKTSKDDVQNAIASIFEMPLNTIIDFHNDSASAGWRAAKEAWMANSPQQIVGLMQNQSMDGIEASHCDYRAGGDWEMLMGEALASASTGCGMDNSESSTWKSFKITGKLDENVKEILGAHAKEERWLRISVCAISQAMPAAALLRFCLAGGKGRDHHPLCAREGNRRSESNSVSIQLQDDTFQPSLALSTSQQEKVLEYICMLARRSARSHGDDLLKRSCFAVASNLLDTAQSFNDIEGIEALLLAFDSIETIRNKPLSKKASGDAQLSAVRFLNGRLIAMIKARGDCTLSHCNPATVSKATRLLTFLGSGTMFSTTVLGTFPFQKKHLFERETSIGERAIQGIVHLLSLEAKQVDAVSRYHLASVVGEVIELEKTLNSGSAIRASLLTALSLLSTLRLQKLIELVFPPGDESHENDIAMEAGLGISKVFAYVLSCGNEKSSTSLKFCKKVFLQLQKYSENANPSSPLREGAFGVLFLYACRVGSLGVLGSSLVMKLNSSDEVDANLIPVDCLLSFVKGLRKSLRGERVIGDEEKKRLRGNLTPSSEKSIILPSQKETAPRACSYVLRNGFFQQHWYNCYTCGLVVDKGCCTICALTCHRGHEVAYSRYSSFFCDCGAEMASAGEENRVVCRCITPMMTEEAEKLFEEERANNYLFATNNGTSLDTFGTTKTSLAGRMPLFVEVAASFKNEATSAIEEIKREATDSPWITTFFNIITHKSGDGEMNKGCISKNSIVPSKQHFSAHCASISLAQRHGKELELKCLEDVNLVPIRAARAGTFNVKMSVETTTDRLKRAMLNRHGIVRKIAVADSRGRLLVAEPCSLAFCSLLPAINTRFIKGPLSSQIGRAQMSVVASYSMSFNIVGMEICRANERHVVVWGATEACVIILRKGWNGVERMINLEFEVDPHDCESDYLVHCDWVPNSQTHVSVTCGTFVKIYDISTSENEETLSSLLSYSVVYEALIKDSTWVSLPFNTGQEKLEPGKRTLLLFLLMDTGRIHEIRASIDNRGDINGCGSIYLERSSSCVDIPTAGIRPYEGVTTNKAGSTTRSLGEGSTLCYLPRMNLLLYKCVSSCVIAMILDETGSISGSFELLPNQIESEFLGGGPDTHSIVGPFHHWTEIGIMHEDFFRLICVGKSSRTNQPKMLCLDVNDKCVKVREMSWSGNGSVGLGLSLSSSFEAIVPFSAPLLSDGTSFSERLYLCTITSNGAVLIYGERTRKESMKTCKSSTLKNNQEEERGACPGKPIMPLTIYEHLFNVSEMDELKFAGDGFGSDSGSIKSKLSTKNSVYLMSPSRDGCSLAVSLEGPIEISKLKTDTEASIPKVVPGKPIMGESVSENLVVVALRLLVGSTTSDCVSSKVYVQGRPVDLVPDAKRWYDLPLTLEESVMAVRNGFVSISFGPTFESGNNPVIDAIEVYAIEKRKLQQFILKQEKQTMSSELRNAGISHNAYSRRLVLTMRILSHLFQILEATLDTNTSEGGSLKQLVRRVSVMEDKSIQTSVVDLLNQVEKDSCVRQQFFDEGTIIGFSEALSVWKQSSLAGQNVLIKFQGLIEASLRPATSIALSRPENYLSATEQLRSEGLSHTSIALDASELLMAVMKMGDGFRDVLKCVVHLVLAEMNISKSQTSGAKSQFASFDVIANLLKSDNRDIVEQCCKAITSFIEIHGPTSSIANLLTISNADRSEQCAPIAYQCDSCSLFPITDTRYTLLEDDHDIDLCTKCHELGRAFAEKDNFSANSPVIINGRSIGGGTKLSCSQISQMQSIRIENGNAIVEQVEQALQEAKSAGICSTSGANDDGLSQSLLLRQQETNKAPQKIDIDFEKFTDSLFSDILSHLGAVLDSSSIVPVGNINPLLSLLTEMIKIGRNETSHVARGKLYVGEVMNHVRRILASIRSGCRSENSRYVLLINLLRSLIRLIGRPEDELSVNDDDGSDAAPPTSPKSKGKTDPRFVCDMHGVPAVRRRCSTGVNKNRRFYVCGMERNQRCKYFKWADESKSSLNVNDSCSSSSWFEKETECILWGLLTDNSTNQSGTLSDQLCDLLEVELSRSEVGKGREVKPSQVKSSTNPNTDSKKSEIFSSYNYEGAMEDLNDGAFCSREKIFGCAPHWLCQSELMCEQREIFLNDEEIDDQILTDKFIEASLDLVSTVASASSAEKKTPGHKRWFSLLCEVISMSPTTRFRSQAKKALKRICGGDRELYHCVRDHYVFGFQFRQILNHAYTLLDGALCVREQARQCGDNWNEEEASWNELNAGSLLGTLHLISEDCLTVENSNRISTIMNEVLAATKGRGSNWRNFCSLQSLPDSNRKHASLPMLGQKEIDIQHSFSGPPILSLFWLSCTISGHNQVNVLKLIDIALTTIEERKQGPSSEFQDGNLSNDVSTESPEVVANARDANVDTLLVPFTLYPQQMPEETLVNGTRGLTVKETYSFILEFVLRGKTSELRRISSQVSHKIIKVMKPDFLLSLFNLLMDKPFFEIEKLGCASAEFLQLLQTIVQMARPPQLLHMSNIASKVANCFTIQMNLFNAIGKGQFFFEGNKESFTKRFDIVDCVSCHRLYCSSQRNVHNKTLSNLKEKKVLRDPSSKSRGEKEPESSKSAATRWLPDQVRPFTKTRLESSTDNTASSEFASYVQLKCRLSISEIRLVVNDPRGRYAKTIIISFTPRQVAEVNQLKSEEYQHAWQECAELSLSRGASSASTALNVPITAANLKFEYRDFHERASGARVTDGSFVLFCPRCSRQVNNAHGVCGNCGECVFQCRRCRHIQYDRPDAFLCTECGHCSSGSFSYELTAGVASNAIAIVDDESFKRTVKIAKTATKLHSELKSALVERLRTGSRKRTESEADPLSDYNCAFKRALIGDLPNIDTEGGVSELPNERRSNASILGRNSSDRSSSNAASRARSLLRLARQLRNENGDHTGRQREIIVREAFLGGNREFSLEEIGDSDGADIISLFGNNADREDPLSRIVATISSRRNSEREARASATNRPNRGNKSGSRGAKKESNKSTVEKLNQLRREAERECYELQQRLSAWNRLEHDSLPEDSVESNETFKASACSRCAGPLTLNILLLMLRFLQTDSIKQIENVITKEFIRSLFLEPLQMQKDLFELKRMMITTLCTKSDHAAKLILEELRTRLRASSDTASASILGKVLETDFPLAEEFVTLATDTLSENYML
mmetsp:Transcript_28026/g.42742  ORF Transcript_28026/g.42742 Transcript_28026/m.42742 type:complete len:4540 (+) Transcript_28026:153-13772(+)